MFLFRSSTTRHQFRGDAQSRPGPQRTSIARTTCRSCSRIGCWADDETLSKVQALRLTTPLADRLEEAAGLGYEFIGAIEDREYYVIMGITLFIGIVIIVMNLLADLVYALLDPRIRY